jgi:hypothetical protein
LFNTGRAWNPSENITHLSPTKLCLQQNVKAFWNKIGSTFDLQRHWLQSALMAGSPDRLSFCLLGRNSAEPGRTTLAALFSRAAASFVSLLYQEDSLSKKNKKLLNCFSVTIVWLRFEDLFPIKVGAIGSLFSSRKVRKLSTSKPSFLLLFYWREILIAAASYHVTNQM